MQTNCVIDISHNNGHLDLSQAAKAGILAVIIKASQGKTFTDPMFPENVRKARTAGLLLGAYHFATGSPVDTQVQNFLNVITGAAPLIPVLDFEENTTPGGTTATLEQVREFVMSFQARTGRLPVLYGGSFLKESLAGQPDAVLSACPLWYASYTASAPHLPPGWNNWLMWQYTDGRVGNPPHTVPGIGPIDRSLFNADGPQVTSWWNDNTWDGNIVQAAADAATSDASS